jgi:hypothetical protein
VKGWGKQAACLRFGAIRRRSTPAFGRLNLADDSMADSDQLKMLFDYTIFHIGLYTSVTAGFITLLSADFAKHWNLKPWLLWIAISCLSLAGFCGGVIASSLPEATNIYCFYKTWIGPFSWDACPARYWAYAEHTLFWVAIASGLVAFAWRNKLAWRDEY